MNRIMKTKILQSTVRKLKAISDSTRVKLLLMLTKKPLCVCELTFALKLAQPTVSRHMKQLENAGFVNSRREGTWTIYFIEPEEDINRQLLDTVLGMVKTNPECQMLLEKLDDIDRCTIAGHGRILKNDAAARHEGGGG